MVKRAGVSCAALAQNTSLIEHLSQKRYPRIRIGFRVHSITSVQCHITIISIISLSLSWRTKSLDVEEVLKKKKRLLKQNVVYKC